ncbi:hypothetical protein KIH39_18285 [Telmatocola sphagniphila]|uniref:Uncharacterized protein n=1 Tax=Telmatocola sphagniphila TaxID=1123043 RepID=A0A8E6EU43_9BACT|nr:hypothetical protein [Telmatocola sphagniphila]QVL30787.1 hypothetical protein KIH39_18285 [Telmatocola sphagniphila]
MKERRPLVAGLKDPIDPAIEKQFVFGSKEAEEPVKIHPKAVESRDPKGQPPINRVPFTSRLRAEFANALKRESLERQLNNQYPNSLQEVLEEALEDWMRAKGYWS